MIQSEIGISAPKRILQSNNSPEHDAGIWIDKQVALAKTEGVITKIVDIGPPLARALLNRNPGNRKVSAPTVDSYARDMMHDAWQFNGEPIIISSDGMLNDGQHRCEAIIKANKDVRLLMVIGVDRETRTTLDQGKIRTTADYLAMEGHANAVPLAAMAGYAWQYTKLGRLAINSHERPTKSEVLEFLQEHPNLATSFQMVKRKENRAIGGHAIVGVAHWIFSKKVGKIAADQFAISLAEGANLAKGSPILYVRNRLINNGTRLRPNEKLELLIKAWNAYRQDETITSFGVTGGKLPKVSA